MLSVIAIDVCAAHSEPAPASDSPGSEFRLVEKRGNIALYERWFLYDSTTKAREIKVVFEVKATVQSAINLLRDETRSSKWNLHSSEFKILGGQESGWVNYIRYDLPWPIDDHDCVLQYKVTNSSPTSCTVSFESGQHGDFPEGKNISRLSNIRGQWQIDSQDGGIRIEYSVTTTPSRVLPRWVTDPIIRNNLLDTMVKFYNLIEKLND